jgi:acetylglutamate kinase
VDFLTKILIKTSGDLTDSQQFFDFVKKKAGTTFEKHLAVICGGGTKISAALKKSGYTIEFDSMNRRVLHSLEEQVIMRDVLQLEQIKLSIKFVQAGIINLNVVLPVLYAGLVMCPINGDDLVKAYSLGFDEIYVVTKPERVDKKKDIFKNYSNVEIVGLNVKENNHE